MLVFDFSTVWKEELSKEDILRRAEENESPIDPSIQMGLLISKLCDSFENAKASHIVRMKGSVMKLISSIPLEGFSDLTWEYELRQSSEDMYTFLQPLFLLITLQNRQIEQKNTLLTDKQYHLDATMERLKDANMEYKPKVRRAALAPLREIPSIDETLIFSPGNDLLDLVIDCLRGQWELVGEDKQLDTEGRGKSGPLTRKTNDFVDEDGRKEEPTARLERNKNKNKQNTNTPSRIRTRIGRKTGSAGKKSLTPERPCGTRSPSLDDNPEVESSQFKEALSTSSVEIPRTPTPQPQRVHGTIGKRPRPE